MNSLKSAVSVAVVGAISFIGVRSLHADEWNKKTIITVNEPLQVPNAVLEPGKYVMKLLESPADRHIVQIFNADETKLVTTILAIPNYRLKPTGKTEFNFWEVPAGQPHALRAWFYPGDNFGQEFAYPPAMSAQISKFNKASMPTTYAENDKDLATAKLGQTQMETATENTSASTAASETAKADATPTAAPEAATAPTQAPAPTPDTASSQANTTTAVSQQTQSQDSTADRASNNSPAELPHTGSDIPSIFLGGLISMGAYAMLTARSRRRSAS